MISIVVCHRNPAFLDQLEKSISETVGVPYEIVIIDNTTNKYNIFQAYNLGIKQSKYDIICFTHEDLIFHTADWGNKVIEHFKDPKVGIIGVAGAHYLPKLPGSHWSSGITSYNVVVTINGETHFNSWRYFESEESSISAVIVDGLWMCCAKSVFNQARFDDSTFSGFHCYDSDICLQIKKLNYDVRIVFDIVNEHFSLGKLDKVWLDNIFRFYNKWANELPIRSIKLTKSEISQAHYRNAKELFEQIRINKFGILSTIKTWFYYMRCNPPINKMNIVLLMKLFNEKF
jgi:hypothetical protein